MDSIVVVDPAVALPMAAQGCRAAALLHDTVGSAPDSGFHSDRPIHGAGHTGRWPHHPTGRGVASLPGSSQFLDGLPEDLIGEMVESLGHGQTHGGKEDIPGLAR